MKDFVISILYVDLKEWKWEKNLLIVHIVGSPLFQWYLQSIQSKPRNLRNVGIFIQRLLGCVADLKSVVYTRLKYKSLVDEISTAFINFCSS